MNRGEKIHSAFVKVVHSIVNKAMIILGYLKLNEGYREQFVHVLQKRRTAILVLLDLAEKAEGSGYFAGEKGRLEKEFVVFFYELGQRNIEKAWAAGDILILHLHAVQTEMKVRLGVMEERPHKSALKLIEEERGFRGGNRAA